VPQKEIQSSDSITAGSIKGVTWITSIWQNKLASLVELDSAGSAPRNFHLIKQINRDSALNADISLDIATSRRYASFPIDSTKELETLLLYEDSTLIGRQSLRLRTHPNEIQLLTDTLDTAPSGYNSWAIQLPDTSLYSLSIAVSDADRSIEPPTTIARLEHSYTEDLTLPIKQLDTSFISFTGKATRPSGKPIKDPFARQLLIAGARDSSYLFTRLVNLDDSDGSGRFTLDSLFFFGKIDLQFQINKEGDGSTKNIRLDLTRFVPPAADTASFAADWEDDRQPKGSPDTVFSKAEQQKYALAKIKTLTPVTVRAWRSPRKELDNKYTTGAFSEPAMYSFDIRTERRFHGIGDYLRANFPRFQGGYSPSDSPSDAMGHPFLFFVDEQNYSWDELSMFDWERIAYIKCFENDFIGDDDFVKWKNNMARGFTLAGSGSGLKVPVSKTPIIIAIYTRKGADFRTMPGGLNRIAVSGYSPILTIPTDRTTLYWDPLAFGNHLRIRFTNNTTARHFRVVIEGANYKGNIVSFHEIIE
ncbi:MAG TPA: hypothetical protein VNW04_03325, partial [Puia sp.]|nr:hypothetical protein [Puia sp.]